MLDYEIVVEIRKDGASVARIRKEAPRDVPPEGHADAMFDLIDAVKSALSEEQYSLAIGRGSSGEIGLRDA
jgi:hypothetical protein